MYSIAVTRLNRRRVTRLAVQRGWEPSRTRLRTAEIIVQYTTHTLAAEKVIVPWARYMYPNVSGPRRPLRCPAAAASDTRGRPSSRSDHPAKLSHRWASAAHADACCHGPASERTGGVVAVRKVRWNACWKATVRGRESADTCCRSPGSCILAWGPQLDMVSKLSCTPGVHLVDSTITALDSVVDGRKPRPGKCTDCHPHAHG